MKSTPVSVEEYLDSLESDRRSAIESLRQTINANLPEGYEEGIQYGMIGWFVPHSIYPPGYHCNPKQPVPFVSVASQKSHIGLYAFCIYADPALAAWFVEEYKKTGKQLDMGKSCIRFKKPEDIPLELIGQTIARVPVSDFLGQYESTLNSKGKR